MIENCDPKVTEKLRERPKIELRRILVDLDNATTHRANMKLIHYRSESSKWRQAGTLNY
jgi:hypothetical protein